LKFHILVINKNRVQLSVIGYQLKTELAVIPEASSGYQLRFNSLKQSYQLSVIS